MRGEELFGEHVERTQARTAGSMPRSRSSARK
jgi:hypothetical protein